MSDAVTIPAVSAPSEPRSWARWPLWILGVVLLVWLLGILITFAIHHTRLRGKLTHRLESVFGRHVEVGNYDFTLWSGPTLTAEEVTFSEDPRFGHEYFLRAESVKVRLHWQSLFRGHMDLGTVSLERPSLNLVRNADGDWNVGEWLPRITSDSSATATAGSKSAPAGAQPYVRFDRILFDDGRINFKRADEKLPFAFTAVTGTVEPDAPGRWRIDLQAVPMRAAVPLQQPGLVHVAAQVGGTSSRFRPVVLALSWQEASVSDLLRLTRGDNLGIRGDFAFALNARADGDDWQLESRTNFRSIHRWDLSLRPDNPDFNVLAKFTVHPQATGFDVEHAIIEAPHSHAEAAAHISWNVASNPVKSFTAVAVPHDLSVRQPTEIQITESRIDLADVLSWIRAFHPDVAADTALKGFASITATVAARPARVTAADIRLDDGAELTGSALRVPAHLSATRIRYAQGDVAIEPAILTFGAPISANGSASTASALLIDASAKFALYDATTYHLGGSVAQVRDLVSTAAALGWPISRGWDVEGPAHFDLRWPATAAPWRAQPIGTIEWGADSTTGVTADTAAPPNAAAPADSPTAPEAKLLAPFLNEPVRAIKARIDLKPDLRRITLSSADAFGAHWTGAIESREPGAGWQFGLSADHLATADVDRWLNPRWRQSFLDRMLPFLGSSAPPATPEDVRAAGRITIDQLTVAPVVARRVQGDLKINGRSIDFTNASAQLASGNVTGSLRAALTAAPVYHVTMNFAGVDLSDLTAAVPSLANQFDGSAAGQLTLASHGATRADLIAALACEGNARIASPQLKAINLDQTFRQTELRAGAQTFREASAEFTCVDSALDFRHLTLSSPSERLDATGSVDFSRSIDLTFTNPATPDTSYQLEGPLASPSVKKIVTTPKP